MADRLDELRAARRELDAAIEDIRRVDGFADFLAPPTFEDVARAAGADPLVYVTAAEPGGLALVVRGTDVVPVELPSLTAPALRERVDAHLAAYTRYAGDREGQRAGWSQALDDLCRWLWDTAMGEVLAALDGAAAATLIAGGLLGVLPLHAAWTPDRAAATGRRYALDELPLSYVPNARALTAARELAANAGAQRLLAVSEPWPVNASRLRAAPLEVEVACVAFPEDPVVLAGPAATARAFRRGAPAANLLHLACHGFADLEQPLNSGLLLADDVPVTLRDLMAMPLKVRLAVLSACETLLPGTSLPDEVIALPTGLLQAGVGGVVASMWAVPDAPTALLMAEFYRRWRGGAQPPAAALREAQIWLRDTDNGEKAEHFQAAIEDGWLPRPLINQLAFEVPFESDRRDHADIRVWAAFAHVGA
jgi:CHAT domain-containing protein